MYKVHCLLVNEQLSMSRPGDLTQTFPATSQSALFVFGSWRPSDSQEDKSVSKKEMALKKELSRQIQTRRCQEFNRMADDRIWWKYIWIILHLFLAVFWLQLVKRNPSERRWIYGQVQLYKNLAIHLLFILIIFISDCEGGEEITIGRVGWCRRFWRKQLPRWKMQGRT